MTKIVKNDVVTLQADAGKVLCDGYSMTSLGGRVTVSAHADYSVWQEMTEEEAIVACNDEEVTGDEFLAMVEEVL